MATDNNHFSRKKFLKYMAAGTAGAPVMAQLLAVNRAFGKQIQKLSSESVSFEELKKEYMLAPDITYFNNASIGTIPKPVFEARSKYLEICESNPWFYMWGGEWDQPREEARKKISRFVNCSPEEVAFTHNTTEVFNLLAHGLPIGPGDEVLYSNLNHAGASIPFEHMAPDRGYDIRKFELPIANIGKLSKKEIIEAHTEQITNRTKLLVIPHMDNTVGLRHPVTEIAEAAKGMGVDFIAVDGAQTIGMIPVDMEELGVDIYATSAHKWVQAPKGVSFSYFRKSIQDHVKPMWVTWGQSREAWADTARRFEDYGTRNLPEVLTLGNAVDFLSAIPMQKREQKLKALWTTAHDLVKNHPDLTWKSAHSWDLSGSLYAVEVKGRKSSEVFKSVFPNPGYVFRAFELPEMSTMRISPNVINTKGEIDDFFNRITA